MLLHRDCVGLSWHHHMTLSLLALWFLILEAGRGEKTPAVTVSQVRAGLALILHRASRCDVPSRVARERTRRLERNEVGKRILSLQGT